MTLSVHRSSVVEGRFSYSRTEKWRESELAIERNEMWIVFYDGHHQMFTDYNSLLSFSDGLTAGGQKYRVQEIVTTHEVVFDNTSQP